MAASNPFRLARDSRDKITPIRFTATELAALHAKAKAEGVTITELVRRGLAMVLDEPNGARS